MATAALNGSGGIVLGGSNLKFQGFFKFMDNLVKSNIVEGSSKDVGKFLDNIAKVIDNAVNNARDKGADISKPIEIDGSFAGETYTDDKSAKAGNAEDDGYARKYVNYEAEINRRLESGAKVNLTLRNDSSSLSLAASTQYADKLKQGDEAANIIMGTGTGVNQYKYEGQNNIVKLNETGTANYEGGHNVMPYLEDYSIIEGQTREHMKDGKPVQNPVFKDNHGVIELYTSGGNGNDRGIIATIENIAAAENDPSALAQIAKKFNDTFEKYGIQEKIGAITGEQIKNSIPDLMNIITDSSGKDINKELSDLAGKGKDPLALAIFAFSNIRAGQGVAAMVNGLDKEIPLLTVSGSYNNKGLVGTLDQAYGNNFGKELQFKVIQDELVNVYNKPGVTDGDINRFQFISAEDTLDGTLPLAEAKVNGTGSGRASEVANLNAPQPEKTQPETTKTTNKEETNQASTFKFEGMFPNAAQVIVNNGTNALTDFFNSKK